MGHFDLAEEYLKAAWSLTQDPVKADHLGQVYEKQGKLHEAAVAYARALSSVQWSPGRNASPIESDTAGRKISTRRAPRPGCAAGSSARPNSENSRMGMPKPSFSFCLNLALRWLTLNLSADPKTCATQVKCWKLRSSMCLFQTAARLASCVAESSTANPKLPRACSSSSRRKWSARPTNRSSSVEQPEPTWELSSSCPEQSRRALPLSLYRSLLRRQHQRRLLAFSAFSAPPR